LHRERKKKKIGRATTTFKWAVAIVRAYNAQELVRAFEASSNNFNAYSTPVDLFTFILLKQYLPILFYQLGANLIPSVARLEHFYRSVCKNPQ
jgi:hypothetical protein